MNGIGTFNCTPQHHAAGLHTHSQVQVLRISHSGQFFHSPQSKTQQFQSGIYPLPYTSHDPHDSNFSHDEGLQQTHSSSCNSGQDHQLEVVHSELIFVQKSVVKNLFIVLFHNLQSVVTHINFCKFQTHHCELNDGFQIFSDSLFHEL